MEYMDAGSLEKVAGCDVPEDVLSRVTRSMVEGLRFLKDELKIMHRGELSVLGLFLGSVVQEEGPRRSGAAGVWAWWRNWSGMGAGTNWGGAARTQRYGWLYGS